ncbi:MAG: acetylxylan esterase [Lentisphaeria bacterium]|nr:acetylxylan esterase [Lentisphaeria bacterium]
MANFGSLLQEYYVDLFRKNAEIRKKKLAALKTPEDVRAYISELRAKFDRAYTFPTEKCPLDPQSCGVIQGDGYKLEKLIYCSRPGFPVTASLYIPENARPGKTPAILHVLGHALYGKASVEYQTLGITLCRKGYLVLMPDPLGQGERFSFPDLPEKNVREHNILNRRLIPAGDNVGAWRIWDAMRSVDMLLARPETDKDRIVVTGNSGGGTLTTLVNAADPRIKAAAPNCYITTWLRLVENENPVDGEQIVHGFAADGGEMADLLILKAPNPLLIMGEKDDFFDIRGTRESFEDVKRIYTILGHPENVRYFEGELGHGYNPEGRKAAYNFFNDFFGIAGDDSEPECKTRTREELACTPRGTILDLPGAKSADMLVREKIRKMAAERPRRSREEIMKMLAAELKLQIPAGAPAYRQLRPKLIRESVGAQSPALIDSRYGIETEPRLITTLHFISPKEYMHLPGAERAELYLPNTSAEKELAKRTLPESTLLFGFDYRGVGETIPGDCDKGPEEFFSLYRWDYHLDAMARLLGFSVLGKRVEDVIKAILLLKQAGTKEITLTASGIGLVPAVLAALFSPVKVKTAFTTRCRTFFESGLSGTDNLPQSMAVADILEFTDMDELQAWVEE